MQLLSNLTHRRAISKLISGIPATRTSSTALTLNREDHNTLIIMTAAVTVTVPAASSLFEAFGCRILATGGTVVVNGPGATDLNLTTGKLAVILVAGNKIYAQDVTLVDLS